VAREIVQEAFVRLWNAKDDQVEPAFEKAWLLRVCRNMAIDARRRQGKVVAVGDVETAAEATGSPPSPSGDDELDRVLSVVSTLSADQQEVVRLKYQQGLSYKEIADVTGHSVSNVGVLLHTALKNLKKKLEGAS